MNTTHIFLREKSLNDSIPQNYISVLNEIKERVYSAQYAALQQVNQELVKLYWDIGRTIVEQQKEKNWGKAIVETLAQDLQMEFPGITGFSARNIRYMRELYSSYCNLPKLQPLVAEIGWTHNLIIMTKCKDDLQREFYLRMTQKMGWTKNVLIHQIEIQAYEKTLLNQTNFEKNLPDTGRSQAKLAVKDEYIFDFLELGEEYSERLLEEGLVKRIVRFLREMGGLFSFVGNQFRIEIGGKEYFIDLLLYHRSLRSLVAIEIKVGDFKPEYVGKMQFYLAVLDDRERLESEEPSIGIILCKTKNKTVVEYALRESNKPIGWPNIGWSMNCPGICETSYPVPSRSEFFWVRFRLNPRAEYFLLP